MKKMMKIAGVLMILVLVASGITAAAEGGSEPVTAVQGGVTYTLDGEGTLTVTADTASEVTGFPSPFGQYRNSLIKIVIGPNITSVDNSAFAGLYNLETVEVGEGVTRLGRFAFAGNSKLQNVTLPSTLKELGYGAFTSCGALTGISLPDGLEIIGDQAFAGDSALAGINMPSGLKQIGSSAFGGCSLLAEVSLPEGLESIGSSAFSGCSTLTGLVIPDSVSSMGTGIIDGCTLIKSITLPAALEVLPNSAFYYNQYLEEVVIPGGVKELGSWAFQYCGSLGTVTISEGLETIGNGTFQGCSALTEIILPASLTAIRDGAFSSSLETVTILSDNVVIAENAFDGHRTKIRCNHASSAVEYANTYGMELEYLDPAIAVVNGVTYALDPDGMLTITGDGENGTGTGGLGVVGTLPGWIYNERGSIVKVVIGENIESVTYAFGDVANLQTVEIGGSVKALGDGVFQNCGSLAAVRIGEGLESIGESAFQGCTALTAIRLPASLNEIEDEAFGSALKTVTILSMDAVISETAFTDQLEAICCYPDSTAEEYAAANSIPAVYFGTEVVENGVIYILDENGTLTVTGDGEKGTGTNGWGIIGTLPTDISRFRNDIINIVTGPNIERIGTLTGQSGTPFPNLRNLESVEIGEGTITVGSQAFVSCSMLQNVSMPSTLKEIGGYAFAGCSSLSEIELPDGLERIESSAFSSCTSLEEIVFPDTVTYLSAGVVAGCTSLKKITLPASLEDMATGTFYNCTGLEEVIIPGGMKAIGVQSFQGCTGLTTVTIGEGFETIGFGAFNGCTSLKEISLPASLKEIRNGAFDATLETATILSSDAVIGDTAFTGYRTKIRCYYDSTATVYAKAHGMEREYLDITGDFVVRDSVLVEYVGKSTALVIPEEYEGQTITAIAENVFAGEAFTSVSIPGSVKTIGQSAFTNNSSLETLSIGEGTETIGNSAFMYCTSLNSVSLPTTLTGIGEHAFQSNTSLTSIVLPDNLSGLGFMAFSDCTSLQEITIPGSVTGIGEQAFARCTGLRTVVVEEGVTDLGTRTFFMNYGSNPALASVTLPDGLQVIGDTCFANNGNLTEITLPSALLTIGQAAFLNTGLREVTIPAGVTEVISAVFSSCEDLKTVTLLGTDTTIDISNYFNADDIWCLKDSATMAGLLAKQVYGPFRIHCIGLPDYEVDDDGVLTGCNMHAVNHYLPQEIGGITVTAIAAGAFANDDWPATIVLPEGLTTIESGALSNLGHLWKVRFPAGVSTIPVSAVSGCTNLCYAVILNPAAVIDENAFTDVTDMTVRCHAGSTAEAFAQGKGFSIEYITGSFVTDGSGTVLEYVGNETEVTVPEGMVSIGESAFKGAAGVQTVTLPRSLTSIGTYAFSGCSQLNLIVYNGAENEWQGIDISENAFDNEVPVYSQLLWSGKITEEDDETSDIRLTLKRDGILYAEGTGEIRDGMMPEQIPYGSGWNDPSIQRGAKKRGTENTVNPDTEPEINMSALPLVIGEGITALRSGALETCSYICTIHIPASMTVIEPLSLYNNYLQGVAVAEGNQVYASVDGVLFTKDGKTLAQYPARKAGPYTLPEGVERIGNYAFSNFQVPDLTLPESLKTIGEGAFYNSWSNYRFRITIPEGLKTVEADAFKWFDGPDYLVMPEGLETIGSNAFSDTSSCIIFTGSPVTLGSEESGFTLYCYPDSTAKEWGYDNNCDVNMIDAQLFRLYGGTIDMPESITLQAGEETEISVTLQPSFFSRIPVAFAVGDPDVPGTQIARLTKTDGKDVLCAVRQGVSYVSVMVGYDEGSPTVGLTETIDLIIPYNLTMLTGQGMYLTNGIDLNVDSSSATPEGQDVLDVDLEYIEALNPGQAAVRVEYDDGTVKEYRITVEDGSWAVLPQGVTAIEEEAFSGDVSFRFVELHANMQRVETGAFANIGDMNVNVLNSGIRFEEGAFTGSNPVFFIPLDTELESYLREKGYLFFYNQ